MHSPWGLLYLRLVEGSFMILFILVKYLVHIGLWPESLTLPYSSVMVRYISPRELTNGLLAEQCILFFKMDWQGGEGAEN